MQRHGGQRISLMGFTVGVAPSPDVSAPLERALSRLVGLGVGERGFRKDLVHLGCRLP